MIVLTILTFLDPKMLPSWDFSRFPIPDSTFFPFPLHQITQLPLSLFHDEKNNSHHLTIPFFKPSVLQSLSIIIVELVIRLAERLFFRGVRIEKFSWKGLGQAEMCVCVVIHELWRNWKCNIWDEKRVNWCEGGIKWAFLALPCASSHFGVKQAVNSDFFFFFFVLFQMQNKAMYTTHVLELWK